MPTNERFGQPRANLDLSVKMDGPFGLNMGLSLNQIASLVDLTPVQQQNTYSAMSLPKSHSTFGSYVLYISPEYGLYQIGGLGRPYVNDANGSTTRLAFDDMCNRLSRKYGEHKLIDEVAHGSIWTAPNEYMMSILKDERQMAAQWNKNCSANLDNTLDSILLFINAEDSDTGSLSVIYSFTNHGEAESRAKEYEDNAL